jgi:tetratricopeptide (TPR) repeat protein
VIVETTRTVEANSPPAKTRRLRYLILAAGAVVLAGLVAGIVVIFVRPVLDRSEGERALRRNDPGAARAPLERCLARRPNDARALHLAAQAARRCDAYADAERYLTAAERAGGQTPATRSEWVLLGAQQGDISAEDERLRAEVFSNAVAAPLILEAMAKGYYAAFRTHDSLTALDQLLLRAPDQPLAYLWRGKAEERNRNLDEAERNFLRAVELAPNSADAHAGLAGILNRRGYTRDAILHYETALGIRPGDPATQIGLARALADAADLPGAERRLDEVLAAHPDHVEALVERSRLALRQHKSSDAESLLAKATSLAPWHRDACQLQLFALKDLGRADEAANCEARLARLRVEDGIGGKMKIRAHDHADDAAVRWDLWQWCLRNGQEEDGLAWLLEVLRINPRHAPAHAALADYFARNGQPRRAEEHRKSAGET